MAYITADHLGSPRIVTDKDGNVTSRKDFTTYGEETVSPQRVGGPGGNGYSQPNIRQDYTGCEKDSESGLQFAQARNFSTVHGRFLSVDPLNESANTADPQTFNRYSYVLNSPYKFTDPLGLLPLTSAGACGNRCSNSDGGMGSGAFSAAMNGGWDSRHRNGPQMLEIERLAAEALDAVSSALWPQAINEEQAAMESPLLRNSSPTAEAPSGSGATNLGQQQISVFQRLWRAHPIREGIVNILLDENGDPKYSNQCAIRLTWALVLGGYRREFQTTFKGATDNGWALRAKELARWLPTVFGKPVELTGANKLEYLDTRTGIVFLDSFPGTTDLGRNFNHIDLWNRGNFARGERVWVETAKKVLFFEIR